MIDDPYGVETAAALVRATALSYERLGDLLVPPETKMLDRPFLPMHISELSALLVQLQEIWEVLGEDAAALLFGAPRRSPVDAVRRATGAPFCVSQVRSGWRTQRRSKRYGDVGAVGPWPHGGDRESPVVRFSELVLHLQENGWPTPMTGGRPFRGMGWALDRESTIDALQRSVELSKTFLARLAARQSEMERGESEVFASPTRLFEMFLRRENTVSSGSARIRTTTCGPTGIEMWESTR